MRTAFALALLLSSLPASAAMQWVKLADSGGPPGLTGATMATLPDGTILYFGGNTDPDAGSTGTTSLTNETWLWTGDGWTKLSPATSPPARTQAALGPFGAGALLVGGYDGASSQLTDAWNWVPDQTIWIPSTPQLLQGQQAEGLAYAATATMPGDQVYLYGGESSIDGITSGLWRFDSYTWTELFPSTTSPAKPEAVRGASMVYDPVTQDLLVVGGQTRDLGYSAQALLGRCDTACAWQSMSDPPPARAFASMAMDEDNNHTVLFGGIGPVSGSDPSGQLGDTWEWDGLHWNQAVDADHGPGARWGARMAWDGIHQRLILYGGETAGFSTTALTDTWAYEAAGSGDGGTVDGGSGGGDGGNGQGDGGNAVGDGGGASSGGGSGHGEGPSGPSGSIYGCNSAGGAMLLALLVAVAALVRRRRWLLMFALSFVALNARAAAPVKVAFLGIKAEDGVAAAKVASLSEYVQSELASLGPYQVIGPDEIQSLVGLEKERQLLGCSDSSCVTEIAGALGVDRALMGSVGRLGDALLLNLSLVDVPHARVVARVGRRATSRDSLEPLLDVVPAMLREMARDDGHPLRPAPKAMMFEGSIAATGAVDLAPLFSGGSPGGYGGLRLAFGRPWMQLVVTLTAPSFGARGEVVLAPWVFGHLRPYLGLGGGVVHGRDGGVTATFLHAGLGVEARFAPWMLFAEASKEVLFGAPGHPGPLLVGGGVGVGF